MKTTKLLFLSIFTVCFAFYSCEVESLDSDLAENAGNNNNNNNTDGPAGGDSTGDYWPLAVGNNWVYNTLENGAAGAPTTMEVSGTEMINGNSNYAFSSLLGNSISGTGGEQLEGLEASVYARKNGGDYIVTVGEVNAEFPGLYSLSMTGYSYIMLKDYLEVGSTWTQNVQTTTTFTMFTDDFPEIPEIILDNEISNEIMEVGGTIEVEGVTYDNVITVKSVMNSGSALDPSTQVSSESYYYFAKDVGIVKAETTTLNEGVTSTSSNTLNSYELF
ncbi:MAG: hypothetical protein BM564_02490 [Bacteroidetes bacterium MedPE-SWsnd-G2]|nr:MAG: hypothetical protein BM564_02490 [Bacteroidetes bacterium MedPE-SWsnd-G2]